MALHIKPKNEAKFLRTYWLFSLSATCMVLNMKYLYKEAGVVKPVTNIYKNVKAGYIIKQ